MINIAEILKKKPKGTKLWTPICGTVSLFKVYEFHGESIIDVSTDGEGIWSFSKEGKFYTGTESQAEMTLFPSKILKNWSKFAWKEGDILANVTDKFFPKIVVFKKFVDEDYSTFESTCGLTVETKLAKYSIQSTLSYCKMKNEDDIRITKEKIDELIREEEAANSPDHTLQPFDKVLVRDTEDQPWRPSFWGCKNDSRIFPYGTTSGNFRYCIPYNEETKHLLGKTESNKED